MIMVSKNSKHTLKYIISKKNCKTIPTVNDLVKIKIEFSVFFSLNEPSELFIEQEKDHIRNNTSRSLLLTFSKRHRCWALLYS